MRPPRPFGTTLGEFCGGPGSGKPGPCPEGGGRPARADSTAAGLEASLGETAARVEGAVKAAPTRRAAVGAAAAAVRSDPGLANAHAMAALTAAQLKAEVPKPPWGGGSPAMDAALGQTGADYAAAVKRYAGSWLSDFRHSAAQSTPSVGGRQALAAQAGGLADVPGKAWDDVGPEVEGKLRDAFHEDWGGKLRAAADAAPDEAAGRARLKALTGEDVGWTDGEIEAFVGRKADEKLPRLLEAVHRGFAGVPAPHAEAAPAAGGDPGEPVVWLYRGVADGRESEDHARHFGKYFPLSAPFAQVRGPRSQHCRCSPHRVTRKGWAKLKAAGARIAEGYDDPTEVPPA